MSFEDPAKLWLLAVLPVLITAYVLLQRRRRKYTMRFTNLAMLDKVAPKRPAWRRHTAAGLMMLMLALLVTAFAQPQREVEVPRERATIVVAIDVSLSMQADDVDPTRLEAAQAAAKSFVENLPPKFNVSLVTFAGSAKVLVPPTVDRQAFLRAVDGIELAPSTATGEAIFTSLEALKQVPADPEHPNDPPPARIALMSDGFKNVGRDVDEGITAAKEARVPIYTIAFGTPYGYVDLEGQRTPVPVDEETMRRIALETDGQSYVAASEAELRQVYEDIGSSVGVVTEQQEVTSEWVGYALVAALFAVAVSLFFFGRVP
ncbi:MAG TPA: VWA domain-containing protein [Actinopolymorphaceae bacterium]